MARKEKKRTRGGEFGRVRGSRHRRVRVVLRLLGLGLTVVAGIMIVKGVSSVFGASGPGEQGSFLLAVLGLPLLGVGLVLLQAGFAGAVTRYFVGETLPVGVDAVNEMAVGTRAAQRLIARELAAGVAEGIAVGSGVWGGGMARCPDCGEQNDADARFCKRCGAAFVLGGVCAGCGAGIAPDARCCTECGRALHEDS